ncbi:hypothetical protein DL766_006866 [Monosporascus sp. MC13-8B]|uniref:Uncharacterized protein n=1 Tax=Monosporascus cannonballus TaxID=155416 RepID=A0ABY0GWX4_9PEZI|nr:hypothetical protein DL762_008174 [Monosporascus cannonballus]RYO82695.1 hypothetical protein DL763_008150 [Monosporascus cannonballus]RYP25984.1 hypothetical protein DL766_006866 [Monosporascus sp. MC13-8B]
MSIVSPPLPATMACEFRASELVSGHQNARDVDVIFRDVSREENAEAYEMAEKGIYFPTLLGGNYVLVRRPYGDA